jgi:hypothetical protein
MKTETRLREKQANDALRALDEMHRLCRIERDEYRWRRRQLLESFSNTTAGAGRDTVRRVLPTSEWPPANTSLKKNQVDIRDAAVKGERRYGARWTTACVMLIGVVAGAAVVYWWVMSA